MGSLILFYFFFSGRQTVADFLSLKTNDKRWGPPLYMSLISVWDYTRLIRRVDLVRTRHRKSPSCLTVLVRLSPFLPWYTHAHNTKGLSPSFLSAIKSALVPPISWIFLTGSKDSLINSSYVYVGCCVRLLLDWFCPVDAPRFTFISSGVE